MKTAIALLLLSAVLSGGYGGYSVGQYAAHHTRMPMEIKNGCAYYDMDTGNFTWGQKPLILGKNNASELQPNLVDLPKTLENPPIPTKKPKKHD